MVPATQTKFVQLDADVVADVQRSGADASHDSAASIDEEFQQYANVKAEAGGTP